MTDIAGIEYRWLINTLPGARKFFEIEARSFTDGSVSLLTRYGRLTSSHQGGGTTREIDLRGRDLMKEFGKLVRSKRKKGYVEASTIPGKVSGIDGRRMPSEQPGAGNGLRPGSNPIDIAERMRGRNERALFF